MMHGQNNNQRKSEFMRLKKKYTETWEDVERDGVVSLL